MKKLLLIFLMLSSIACQAGPPVILVLGDSLSAAYGIEQEAGWVSLLQKRLVASHYPHRVINASISGDTTIGGLNRLPRAIQQHKPAVLIIELGGNDGLRGFGFQQTRRNLEQMVRLGLDAESRVLLLGMMLPPNFGKVFTEKFLGIYQQVSTRTAVPLVPFFLDGVADRPGWMQGDNIHPNGNGQPVMLDNVWRQLEPLLPGYVSRSE
ncbi:arylesterase [Candidatus Vondammii sp. HM_W22]|uniref:arylesterase n=1 Tax=Candidatus Vondammii sp. HM_W22 TaxID=2687299 RepID=UPI001F140D98|nr:arylesterase [Candidatus Vondammii sp. HM_W22]